MEKEYTYDVGVPTGVIGWRKTAKEAGEFAADLLTFPTGSPICLGHKLMYDTIIIKRRERKEGDFDY